MRVHVVLGFQGQSNKFGDVHRISSYSASFAISSMLSVLDVNKVSSLPEKSSHPTLCLAFSSHTHTHTHKDTPDFVYFSCSRLSKRCLCLAEFQAGVRQCRAEVRPLLRVGRIGWVVGFEQWFWRNTPLSGSATENCLGYSVWDPCMEDWRLSRKKWTKLLFDIRSC